MKNFYLIILAAFVSMVSYAQTPNWQWVKSAGGADDDTGGGIVTDAAGNSYVTGTFTSASIIFGTYTLTNTPGFGNPATDLFIVKYDPSGNVVWAKNYGGTSAAYGVASGKGIALDGSGNIYVTGIYFGDNV